MNIFPWQQELWQRLVRTQVQQRLPHAWLITGSEGLGKTHLAYCIAEWLLCNQSGNSACGQCRPCLLWKSQQHPDFYELSNEDDARLNTASARELKLKLAESAQQNGSRVVLIKTAEQLTTAAANALLKLIEEPPAEVYFLLVTAHPLLLPVTLRSRCQLLHISTPAPEQALSLLQTQTQASEAQATKALQLTFGAPLNALQLLEKPELLNEREQSVNDFLALLSGKQTPLTLAAKWNSLEENSLFSAVEYVLRRLTRQACGVNNSSSTAFADVPLTQWFKLYEIMLQGRRQLLEISGLNRQLFWEGFFCACNTITYRKAS